MKISLIVAISDNGVIGNQGKMPWKMRSDMKYFRHTTMHKPVIMGRKTWESLNAPLANRDNIVVTRQEGYAPEGAIIAPSVEKAIAMAEEFAEMRSVDEVMIVGGSQIYELTLPMADRVYFTEIHMNVEGDTFFRPLDKAVWQEVSRSSFEAGKRDDADYSFVIYEKG